MKTRLLALWDNWLDKDHGWLNARLMTMIGMLVSSAVVVIYAYRETLTAEIFLIYLAYAGGSASFFKHVDNRTAIREMEISSDIKSKNSSKQKSL